MLLEIHNEHPEPRKIRQAVEALRRGQVIAYPTDTCYGLGCDLLNKKAIDALYRIKGMKSSQLLSFICRDLSEVAQYAVLNDYEYKILKKYLPGPYCFILNATRDVPKTVQSNRKTIGIRIPDHPVAIALIEELGNPIMSSTACRDGGDAEVDPKEIDGIFKGLGLVLDGGAGGEQATSVIDLSGDSPVIIRHGAGDLSDFL